MKIFVRRAVALLLLPALIVDPAMAAHISGAGPAHQTIVGPRILEEALAARLYESARHVIQPIKPAMLRELRAGFVPLTTNPVPPGPVVRLEQWFHVQDMEKFVKQGSLVFDIDGTLLERRKSLNDHPATKAAMVSLLKKGVRIAIISGNSYDSIEKRVLEPLREALGDERALVDELLTVYADGSTSRRDFQNGLPVQNPEYGSEFDMTEDEVSAVLDVLKAAGKDKFGLAEDQVQLWKKWFAKEGASSNWLKQFLLPWADGDGYEPVAITDKESGNKDGQPLASPWFERRGRTGSIKMVPMDVPGNPTVKTEVRYQLIERLHAEPRLARIAKVFDIRTGGATTIDVAAAKYLALNNYMQSKGLDPEQVYYFGDEFEAKHEDGFTIYGNDLSIFPSDGRKPWVNARAVNRMKAIPENLTARFGDYEAQWIGVGPLAVSGAMEQLDQALGARSTSSSEKIPSPRPLRTKTLSLIGCAIEVREGSNVTIDISRLPTPTARIAMEDFLQAGGYKAEQGVYIGDQNSSKSDLDGMMAQIPGLRVLAVDADQGRVIPEAQAIGAGPSATQAYLESLLELPDDRLPAFIGLNVGETMLGRKIVGGKKIKETLLGDRREIAEALIKLQMRGIQIAFFSLGDSRLIKERVALPLAELLRKMPSPGRSLPPTVFYTSGMVTKFQMIMDFASGASLRDDLAYGGRYRLPAEVVRAIREVLGKVEETEDGQIRACGLLGHYYKERLASPDASGRYRMRPEIARRYPGFTETFAPRGNTEFPQVVARDEGADGSTSQVVIQPLATERIGEAPLPPGEADERNLLFDAIVDNLKKYVREARGTRPPHKDRVLLEQKLSNGAPITEEMLDRLRALMGVEDLVEAQRIPEAAAAAVERARKAIDTIVRRLREQNLDLSQVTPAAFAAIFGVMPVIMAAGNATRFSSFLHKTLTRAGLGKTNIGFAIEGTYCTPGVKRTIMVTEKIIGFLVRDDCLQGYDAENHLYRLREDVTALPPGRQAKLLDQNLLDARKVEEYLGLKPEDVHLVYTQSFGHGDMVNGLEVLPEKEAAYVQVGFGEMSQAFLPTHSSPSFIAYLEILARDADAVAGGKRADLMIEGKGNFFFNKPEELMSYTDWEQVPHKEATGGKDLVAHQWARQQQALEVALGNLPLDPAARALRIEHLRSDYPQFVISDDGQIFTQERLKEAKAAVARWGQLRESEKEFWRRHFAIFEWADGQKADLIISSNTGIFRVSVLRELSPEIDRLYEAGHFAEYVGASAPYPRVNEFWGVDPKNGKPKTLAWNLVRLLARKARAEGRADRIGFVFVGEAPSSIKDAQRQLEFARQVTTDLKRPTSWKLTLSKFEKGCVEALSAAFDAGLEPLAELTALVGGQASLTAFRRVVQGLFMQGREASWQGRLLTLLDNIARLDTPAIQMAGRSQAESHGFLAGTIELLIGEAVDAGWIFPENSPEGRALLEKYRASQKSRGREEYLATRLSSIGQSVSGLIDQRRQDYLTIVKGNKAELSELLRRNMLATHLSLETLVGEDRLPAAHRDRRPSPIKSPEAFSMTGGTSGNFYTGVLPEIVETTPAAREVRLNTIIGLSPYDNGGGSRRIMDDFRPYLGDTPPPGDEVNVMAGLTTARKRWVLRYRTGDEKCLLKDKMFSVLRQAYRGVDDEGNVIADGPVDEDWATFCHHMLRLAELLDDQYIKDGKVSIAGNSIGNFLNVGMKLWTGAYNPKAKVVDSAKYSEALQRMLNILGIYDIHIVPSSFVPGVLYAKLEAPSLKIGKTVVVLDDATIAQGRIVADGQPVELSRASDGPISVAINGRTVTIKERFGDVISLDNPSGAPDSLTVLTVLGQGGYPIETREMKPDGRAADLTVGGVAIKIRGRLVIEQTRITESLHDVMPEEIGLINGVVPTANPEFVALLEKTHDIVTMGPGSFVTSLLPELLSPEIVAALKARRKAGLPTALIVNPFRDNETVGATYAKMIALIERTTGCRFEELFDQMIVNDPVALARQALEEDDHGKSQTNFLKMLELMNKLEKDRDKLSEAKSPKDFANLAKYSRGVMGATDAEVAHLAHLVRIGGIPRDFELEDVKRLKSMMQERGINLILRPLATLSKQEHRQAGGARYEEGVGYEREVLGEVLDEILREESVQSRHFQELQKVFGDDTSVLESEVSRMMGFYSALTRQDVLEQMHRWWIERHWPDETPLFTPAEARAMPMPKAIIANVAYTLIWLDAMHRSKAVGERLVRALNRYLSAGGVLVLLSGFSWRTVHDNLIMKIDPALRSRVVIASSGGAQVRHYDAAGTIQEPVSSSRQLISSNDRDVWYAVVQKVCREFELNKPLRSLSGKKIDGPVHLDEREASYTIETVGRTNLPPGVARRINEHLRDKGLADYQIDKVDGYYDIRAPIVKRLAELLAKENLSVKIIPALRGQGAINMNVVTPLEAYDILHEAKIIESVAGRPVSDHEIVLLGRRKEEFTEVLPNATALVFNLFQSPENLPPGVRVYQGPPGAEGVAEFLDLVVPQPEPHDNAAVSSLKTVHEGPGYRIERFKNQQGQTIYRMHDLAAGSSCDILEDRGMTVGSFKANINGQPEEVLYYPGYPEDVTTKSGGIPMGWPNLGRIARGLFNWKGKVHDLNRIQNQPGGPMLIKKDGAHPNHGHVRYLPFEITATGKDEHGVFVTGHFDTKEYPDLLNYGDVVLTKTIYLSGNELRFADETTNNGSESLPIFPGYHPWFLMDGPMREAVLQVPADETWAPTPDLYPLYQSPKPVSGKLDLRQPTALGDKTYSGDILVLNPRGRPTISALETGHRRIEVTADANHKAAVIYTSPDGKALALETQIAPPDAINLYEKTGLEAAKPAVVETGETFKSWMTIRVTPRTVKPAATACVGVWCLRGLGYGLGFVAGGKSKARSWKNNYGVFYVRHAPAFEGAFWALSTIAGVLFGGMPVQAMAPLLGAIFVGSHLFAQGTLARYGISVSWPKVLAMTALYSLGVVATSFLLPHISSLTSIASLISLWGFLGLIHLEVDFGWMFHNVHFSFVLDGKKFVVAGRGYPLIETYGLIDRVYVGPFVIKTYERPVEKHGRGPPRYILGISGTWHDAAACLFKDGRLISALEEERITRTKHDSSLFPENAVRRLLDDEGITLRDIGHVAIGWDFNLHADTPHSQAPLRTFMRNQDKAYATMKGIPVDQLKTRGLAEKNVARYQPEEVRNFLMNLAKEEKIALEPLPRISFVPHHLAHAASAYYPSGFKSPTLVVCIDGYGDNETTSIWRGEKGKLQKIASLRLPDSLGWVWAAAAEYTGFKPASQEGELMGFAAFGKPREGDAVEEARVKRIREFFDRLITVDNGVFHVDPEYIYYGERDGRIRITEKFLSEMNPIVPMARTSARTIDPERDRALANFAYVLQEKTNDLVLKLIEHYILKHPRTMGLRHLAYAGGIALNIVTSRHLIESGLIEGENIFIPPVPTDAGTAVGAALAVLEKEYGVDPSWEMNHAHYGPSYSDGDVQKTLESFGLVEGEDFEKMEGDHEVAAFTAAELAVNRIVAWFQNGSEFGPRALLNRSILYNLSDPLSNKMANITKERQPWRPSAISLLDEDAATLFSSIGKAFFMVLSAKVPENESTIINAGVHTDGTTRPQVVTRAANPLAWDMLKSLKGVTGLGGVVNTSFNRKEPIVESPEEALNSFYYMKHWVQDLLIGHFRIKNSAIFHPSILSLADEPATSDAFKEAMETKSIAHWDNVFEKAIRINKANPYLHHFVTVQIFKPGLPDKILMFPLVREMFEGPAAEAIQRHMANKCYNEAIQDGALHIHVSCTSHKMGRLIYHRLKTQLESQPAFQQFANFFQRVDFSYAPEQNRLTFFPRRPGQDGGLILGVDVGASWMKVIAQERGITVYEGSFPSTHESALALKNQIRTAIDEAARSDRCRGKKIQSIGIALPGVVQLDEDGRGSIQWLPNFEGDWHSPDPALDYIHLNRIVGELTSSYGTTHVNLINDVKAFGVNELVRQPESFANKRICVIALGTGMGTVIVEKGSVNFGRTHQAGDIIIEYPSRQYDPSCRGTGCVAAFLSIGGFMQSDEVRELRGMGVQVKDFNALDRLIRDQKHAGHELVQKLARKGGKALAAWVQQMENFSKLDGVILTGGVSHMVFGERLIRYANEELDQMGMRHVSVSQSQDPHASHSGAVGAALFAQRFMPYRAQPEPARLGFSILGAKEEAIPYEVEEAEAAGLNAIHIDHLDGQLTKNEPVDGVKLVSLVRGVNKNIPLQVHLMAREPSANLLDHLVAAGMIKGQDRLLVHYDAFPGIEPLKNFLRAIRDRGLLPVLVISPQTEIEVVKDVKDLIVDQTLQGLTLMSVPPGASRQKFIEGTYLRLEKLTSLLRKEGVAIDIQLDGGMNEERARKAVRLGASSFVIRTYLLSVASTKVVRMKLTKPLQVVYSLMDANKDAIQYEVREAIAAGVDAVHVDHMDGRFSKNTPLDGIQLVSLVRQESGSIPLQVHVMVKEPSPPLLEDLARAGLKKGQDQVLVHFESFEDITHLKAFIQAANEQGFQCGLVISPTTSVQVVSQLSDLIRSREIRQIELMSVPPGATRQNFFPNSFERLERLKGVLADNQLGDVDIQMDGAMDEAKARQAVSLGVKSVVVRTYLLSVSPVKTKEMKMTGYSAGYEKDEPAESKGDISAGRSTAGVGAWLARGLGYGLGFVAGGNEKARSWRDDFGWGYISNAPSIEMTLWALGTMAGVLFGGLSAQVMAPLLGAVFAGGHLFAQKTLDRYGVRVNWAKVSLMTVLYSLAVLATPLYFTQITSPTNILSLVTLWGSLGLIHQTLDFRSLVDRSA